MKLHPSQFDLAGPFDFVASYWDILLSDPGGAVLEDFRGIHFRGAVAQGETIDAQMKIEVAPNAATRILLASRLLVEHVFDTDVAFGFWSTASVSVFDGAPTYHAYLLYEESSEEVSFHVRNGSSVSSLTGLFSFEEAVPVDLGILLEPGVASLIHLD